jgi:hypothetical protein
MSPTSARGFPKATTETTDASSIKGAMNARHVSFARARNLTALLVLLPTGQTKWLDPTSIAAIYFKAFFTRYSICRPFLHSCTLDFVITVGSNDQLQVAHYWTLLQMISQDRFYLPC